MSTQMPNVEERRPNHDVHNMPSEFQLVTKAFEDVAEYLKKMADMPGADTTKATHYCEAWADLFQNFEFIMINMHRIATVAAQCIDDFVKNYCAFLALDSVAIATKIEQLELFRKTLCGIFGEHAKELTDLAERVLKLKSDVSAFGFELKNCPPNVKRSVEDEIGQLQAQLNEIDSTIISLKYADRYWGLISVPFVAALLGGAQVEEERVGSSLLPSKTHERADLKLQLKNKRELEDSLRGYWKKWATNTSECCEQIESIKNQLDVIKHVWMALRADSEALLVQLMFVTQSNQDALFKIRLKNLEDQYRAVYDAFYKFTHHAPTPPPPPPPPPPPLPSQQPRWHRFRVW